MKRRSRVLWILAAAILLALAPTPSAAEEATAQSTAHITYVTGTSVYLDAGEQEGLREGDEIRVVRGSETIATLKVTFLSVHRAACSIVSASASPAVGDAALFAARVPPAGAPSSTPQAPAGTGGSTESQATRRSAGTLHGRVGARYLVVMDRTINDSSFSQPAMDARLDGFGLAGGTLDLAVDVRARRTYQTLPQDQSTLDSDSRIYRLAASIHTKDSGQRLTVGRQFAPGLASLSIFDGALYEIHGESRDGGLFAGVQPDAVDMGFSGDISEYGGFFRFHGPAQKEQHWAITTGAVGSYTQGEINREFVFVQGNYQDRRLSAYVTEEVDYNRGWKSLEAGESTVSPTSTFVSLYFRAGKRVTFYTGYDDRRNVRLYQDRVTPVTEFDDSFRQGLWGGASLHLGEHLFTSAEARSSSGGPSGSADAYSLTFGAEGLSRQSLGVQARGTQFTNESSDGWLGSLEMGMNLGPRLHWQLGGGRIEETNRINPDLDRSITWGAIDLDVAMGQRWFLFLSLERNQGDLENNDQAYAGLSYRF